MKASLRCQADRSERNELEVTEEEEAEGRAFHRRHRRWSRGKAWGRGAIRKSQKEGNTSRIFLGVSQLMDSLGFERKMARGWGRAGELEVEMSSVRVTGPRWWVIEAGSRLQTHGGKRGSRA